MVWTFTRTSDGTIEAHDGQRVRATISKRPKSAKPWCVNRITKKLNGETDLHGGDTFRTLTEAKNFCSDNPSVWGVSTRQHDSG